MSVVKGADVAQQLTLQITEEISQLKGQNIQPCATIIRIGEKQSDISYEKGATKKLESMGIEVRHILLPPEVSQEDFMRVLSDVNQDPAINGILLLRPLPPHLDDKCVTESINPLKDIDAISPYNIFKVMTGDPTGFAPCTAEAVMRILDYLDVDLTGKRACVVGQGMVVGRPLSLLLLNKNATVTMCHIYTKDLVQEASQADILVAAAGKRNLITSAHVKEGAVVIDVGINVDEEGHLCGDVTFSEAEGKAQFITPVPGGVGAVTTTVLADHVAKATKLQHGLR